MSKDMHVSARDLWAWLGTEEGQNASGMEQSDLSPSTMEQARAAYLAAAEKKPEEKAPRSKGDAWTVITGSEGFLRVVESKNRKADRDLAAGMAEDISFFASQETGETTHSLVFREVPGGVAVDTSITQLLAALPGLKGVEVRVSFKGNLRQVLASGGLVLGAGPFITDSIPDTETPEDSEEN